jgi:uncharacterized membrane protein
LILVLGLVVFLGGHSLTTARRTRAGLIGSLGEGAFKGLFSLVSAVGLVLIVWGFARYREHGWVQLWTPPDWTRHIAMLLMWFAFVSLAASGRRPGRIRGWLRHPMLGGVVLFGSFLAWAVFDRIAVKRRGDMGAPRVASFTAADAIVVGGGTVAYVAMIYLHPVLIGVSVLR